MRSCGGVVTLMEYHQEFGGTECQYLWSPHKSIVTRAATCSTVVEVVDGCES